MLSRRIGREAELQIAAQENVLPSVRLLNREDRDRVRRFISLHEARLAREEEALALLSARLERGRLVESVDFPDDVVTLDSQVRMRDADSGRLYVIAARLPQTRTAWGPCRRRYRVAIRGAAAARAH
jgi:hypothetical protein